MRKQSRRDVVGELAATGVGLSIGMGAVRTAAAATQEREQAAEQVKRTCTGHLHALGLNPALFPAFDPARSKTASVLSSLDLKTGKNRQTVLDMAGGHMTCGLARGGLLCVAHHKPKSIVVDAAHNVIAELMTGPDHVFGGHAWVDDRRGIALLPQRRRSAHETSDVGSLLIYDATTFRLLDQVETGGIHPHELHPIPGTDELAVTHYGDVDERHSVFEHNVVDSKLTILDARTLKPKRHYPQGRFNAMVTYMRVDDAGWAYLVLTQYIPLSRKVAENPLREAIAELETVLGHPLSFEIPQAALRERMLPVPLPLLMVHTQTGQRRVVYTGDGNHLRSQSVAYSDRMQSAIAVYSHSDTLVIKPREGAPRVVTAARLGLRDLRGVAAIPATALVAVMASYRNAVIYDIEHDVVVESYETQNYQDTHISFEN